MNKPTDFWDEDDICFECGSKDYHESKTPGLCIDCHNESFSTEPDRLSWDAFVSEDVEIW